MKRLFIGLLLMLMSVTAQANVLGLDYELELSWVPTCASYELVEDTIEIFNIRRANEMFVIAMSARVWLWDVIFVGGKIGILMDMITYRNFDPWWTEYMFEVGLQFGILEIFYEHICSHPQSTYPVWSRVIGVRGEGAHDKLGVRVKGSTR